MCVLEIFITAFVCGCLVVVVMSMFFWQYFPGFESLPRVISNLQHIYFFLINFRVWTLTKGIDAQSSHIYALAMALTLFGSKFGLLSAEK